MSLPPERKTDIPQNEELISEDSPLYHPPVQPEDTDALDAAVDGTSALHYGANDPALYGDAPATEAD